KPWLRKRAAVKGETCNSSRVLGCCGCGNHQPVSQRGQRSNGCCSGDNLTSVVTCDRPCPLGFFHKDEQNIQAYK
ncbi:hypothetical protein LX36DRAFT_621894, partial [Colletotrichum falcatum]